jgi:hypothetical protein
MSILVGFTVSPRAQLEAHIPKELQVFVEQRMGSLPDFLNQEMLLTSFNKELKNKFGPRFEASYLSAVTNLPADEYDDEVMLYVDAYTYNTTLH